MNMFNYDLPSKKQTAFQFQTFNAPPQSPPHMRHNDSLIFSVTSQKNHLSKETFLLESKDDQMGKELQSLQLKLEDLENKVQSITSEAVREDQENKENNLNTENISMVGKIARKKPLNSQQINQTIFYPRHHFKRSSVEMKTSFKRPTSHSFDRSIHSRADSHELFQKFKQITQLKRQLTRLRSSAEKSQRSKSKFNQKLIQGRLQLKHLRSNAKKYEGCVLRLAKQLKKSQNIRQKQKAIILKQKQEIAQLKKMLQHRTPISQIR